ncbi:hypothetical protein Sp245p_03350 [Azospirillum baldaniorum]|uniref:Uncharacterized protein n=1 Tax=Azospirillum baldaniorum TaxID=1064539 RepID=A0A9P1JTC7_9PROT|nr:hypothetical protein [Azospirillum baldaniorum]AWJ88890.1 hypothetical protein Sp245p_03350 [Azospirillum baldaniorum]TWA73400.1 hypothetical protein FBZ85_11692 [Azospirillum brasilense]CCC99404.1 protein of unknown function [Azospirillum baldaniorum]
MAYDKGPQDIPIPDAVVHEAEAAALDTVSFARRHLPPEWFAVMETVLKRQEDAAKALNRAQDPRALK